MSIAQIMDKLPYYAIDQKTNLLALSAKTTLSEQQKWGCFLACAYAAGEPSLIANMEAEVEGRLSEDAVIGAKKAASIMAMNTVYYGAINLLQNHDYRTAEVALSMTALTSPGVDKIDFELWAFAISAMSGCAACLNAHETELHKRRVSLENILMALKIAAVMQAAASTMRIEGVSPR